MKKIFIVAFILCIAQVSYAQLFAGGQIGFNRTSVTDQAGNETKSNGWTLAPELGYHLNERFDIGLGVEYSYVKNDAGPIEVATFAIAPFARFMAIEFGNLSIHIRGDIYYANQNDKENDETTNAFGLRIAPLAQYKLSDSFSLVATLNFASLGFEITSGEGDSKSTSFGFGADSGNVMNTNDFQIGFIYNF